MSKEKNNRIIVVLGMHRSGTSAIARALALLGVELGEDLHPAGFDNPTGFWEDRSIIRINEQLLSCLSSGYVRLAPAWEHFENEKEINRLKIEATQLVTQKLNDCGETWGFKDPRTCRLLSFWSEIFLGLDCKVGYVIALRNPASVVASLAKRNNIPAERAYLLWLQHMLPAVLQTNGSDRVVVQYEKLLEAPYEQLVRISSSLNLSLPARNSPSVKEYENEFLQAHLCHSQFSLAELLCDSRAPASVGSLYQALTGAASDREHLDALGASDSLHKLKAELAEATPIFNFVNFLEEERASLLYSVAEREGRIDSLNQQVANLIEAASNRDRQISSLNNAVVDRDRQIASLNGQIANLNEYVAERDREVAGLVNSRSWRLTKPLRLLWRYIA